MESALARISARVRVSKNPSQSASETPQTYFMVSHARRSFAESFLAKVSRSPRKSAYRIWNCPTSSIYEGVMPLPVEPRGSSQSLLTR